MVALRTCAHLWLVCTYGGETFEPHHTTPHHATPRHSTLHYTIPRHIKPYLEVRRVGIASLQDGQVEVSEEVLFRT